MNAPERIWAWTSGQAAGIFDTSFHDNISNATEYVRADIYRNLALDALAAETQAAEAYDAQLKAEAELAALHDKVAALLDAAKIRPLDVDRQEAIVRMSDLSKLRAALAALEGRANG